MEDGPNSRSPEELRSPTPYVPPHVPYLDENGLSQRSLIEEMGPKNATNNYMGPKLHNIFPLLSRRPFRVSPEIFTHNSLLRAFTERLLMESWFINGAQERQICEEEARLRMGPVGKSIFLAYARSIAGVTPQTLWSCLICEAVDVSTKQFNRGYTYSREDRILKHIRHHFEYRPWFCSGRCGTARWWSLFVPLIMEYRCLILISNERFLSKYNLDAHQRGETKIPCNQWYDYLYGVKKYARWHLQLVPQWHNIASSQSEAPSAAILQSLTITLAAILGAIFDPKRVREYNAIGTPTFHKPSLVVSLLIIAGNRTSGAHFVFHARGIHTKPQTYIPVVPQCIPAPRRLQDWIGAHLEDILLQEWLRCNDLNGFLYTTR